MYRLTEAQGESHILSRYENGVVLPPPTRSTHIGAASAGNSASIAIPGNHGNRGNYRMSPLESDDDTTFPVSRSWDDIEGARRSDRVFLSASYNVEPV